jgi:hypothetical protein
VSIDGQPPGAAHGFDVDDAGNGTIVEPRLYRLSGSRRQLAIDSSISSSSMRVRRRSRSRSADLLFAKGRTCQIEFWLPAQRVVSAVWAAR